MPFVFGGCRLQTSNFSTAGGPFVVFSAAPKRHRILLCAAPRPKQRLRREHLVTFTLVEVEMRLHTKQPELLR